MVAHSAVALADHIGLLANLELDASVAAIFEHRVADDLRSFGFEGLAETLPQHALLAAERARLAPSDEDRERVRDSWRGTLAEVSLAMRAARHERASS